MIDIHSLLAKHFSLTECDTGKYADFKAGPLRVATRRFEAEGIGSVSILSGSAMLGMMKLVTAVVNPYRRDLPLLSFDEVSVMGKGTWLVEYYDTVAPDTFFDEAPFAAVKAGLAGIGEYDLGRHWYDNIRYACSIANKDKAAKAPAIAAAVDAVLAAYAAAAAALPQLGEEGIAAKQERTARYVEGLLTHGGPSTDAFVKAIGPKDTRELFTRVVFRTVND